MEREKLQILKEIFGSSYKVGDEYLFYCPRCDHHKRKLSINLGRNCFKCWICDYRGKSIYRLIRRYGSFSHKLKWENFEDTIDLSNVDSVELAFFSPEIPEEYMTIDLPKEFESLCNKTNSFIAKAALKYLKERGVEKKDILKWKIGYCPSGEYAGRIIIPSFDDRGNANYFIGRTYSNHYIKYRNVSVSKNNVIFNELYVDWESDLVIVEGVFDAMNAENAIPLLGSSLREDSKLISKIIKHDTPVYLALDEDAKKKTLKVLKTLLEYDIELYQIDIDKAKDVGDMTKEEFLIAKEKAHPVTFDNYLLYLI